MERGCSFQSCIIEWSEKTSHGLWGALTVQEQKQMDEVTEKWTQSANQGQE